MIMMIMVILMMIMVLLILMMITMMSRFCFVLFVLRVACRQVDASSVAAAAEVLAKSAFLLAGGGEATAEVRGGVGGCSSVLAF